MFGLDVRDAQFYWTFKRFTVRALEFIKRSIGKPLRPRMMLSIRSQKGLDVPKTNLYQGSICPCTPHRQICPFWVRVFGPAEASTAQ